MNWITRLNNIEIIPCAEPTKPTKGGFVGFEGVHQGRFQILEADVIAVVSDDVGVSDAPKLLEQKNIHAAQLPLFKGAAEWAVEALDRRNAERDERRLYLECRHLSGGSVVVRQCGQWQALGRGNSAFPTDLPSNLQRRGPFIFMESF